MSRFAQATLICVAVAVVAIAAVALILGKEAVTSIATILLVVTMLLVWFWNS